MSVSVNVIDHMLRNPITIAADAPLADAVRSILRNKISGICVIDNDKKLLGVLSEIDCLQGFLAATYNSSSVGSVSEYMTKDVDVVHLQDNIINVANDMMSKSQRRRPVVENGKLVGQISCRQLLLAVDEFSRKDSFV